MTPKPPIPVGMNDGVKAVFFDIGNVLLMFEPREILRKMCKALDRPALSLIRYLWSSRLAQETELGKISGKDVYAKFKKDLGYRGGYEDFKALWCDHFTLNRGTLRLVRRVAKRRPVYFLSNTNDLHYAFIRRRYGLHREARTAFLSFKMGARKPEPRIFLEALRRTRVKPHEAAFIDDLKENVAAARKLGLRAARFEGHETLERQLKEWGLL